jgi:hypothetical protein
MDLNFKELQFVAGELEDDECRKLASQLNLLSAFSCIIFFFGFSSSKRNEFL